MNDEWKPIKGGWAVPVEMHIDGFTAVAYCCVYGFEEMVPRG